MQTWLQYVFIFGRAIWVSVKEHHTVLETIKIVVLVFSLQTMRTDSDSCSNFGPGWTCFFLKKTKQQTCVGVSQGMVPNPKNGGQAGYENEGSWPRPPPKMGGCLAHFGRHGLDGDSRSEILPLEMVEIFDASP